MSPVGQDQRVPRLRAEGSVHEGTATSHQAVGGRPVGARRQCLLWVDCVAKVVLQEVSKILRAAGAFFV
jgi:hypothetical protein